MKKVAKEKESVYTRAVGMRGVVQTGGFRCRAASVCARKGDVEMLRSSVYALDISGSCLGKMAIFGGVWMKKLYTAI